MTVEGALKTRQSTSRISMSWYLRPTHPLLAQSADLAGALTLTGRKGPAVAQRLRDSGRDVQLQFDGCAYAGQELPEPRRWVDAQIRAGADHLLLPGVYVPWDKADDGALLDVIAEQVAQSEDLGAGLLLALDVRWLARRSAVLLDALGLAARPVAVVLADRADPLAVTGAVAGLRRLAARLPDLRILRSDHGALGAVAFGAAHASLGLTTSTRHFAASSMRPHKLPGGSSRVFVRPLVDWFRASEIAGWTAAGLDLTCRLSCCGGQQLARFLDDDLDATWHNMNALSNFADTVLTGDRRDGGIAFLNECRAAAARYGLAGFKGPENPKLQLTGWAFC